MNGPESPQRLRLSSAPGSALAAGLSAARTREPTDAQLRALETALAASLGAAGVSAAVGHAVASTPAAPSPFVSAGALKITALLVGMAAAGAGVAMLRHQPRVDPSKPTAPVTPALPTRGTNSPPPAGVTAPPIEQAAPAPRLIHAERAADRPRPRRAGAPADELALITRAQRALASEPAVALALIEGHRRALGQSAFEQEAEVIAVAALARLGRADEARQRAARFVAHFPDSVHAARMRRVAAIVSDDAPAI